jgi:hypothetical protein
MVVYILIVDVINVMQSASILKKFVLKIIVLALRGVRWAQLLANLAWLDLFKLDSVSIQK